MKSLVGLFLDNVVAPAIALPIQFRLRRFEAATKEPQRVQEARLFEILRTQADTDFGRDHRFDTIRSVADFRNQLPIAGYEAVEPYMARVRKGQTRALLTDRRIHMFAMTSGTTATRKYIPVTPRYLADYKRSWNLWGLQVLMRDHRELLFRPIVQMAGDPDEFRTEAGIPCGAVTGLTARMQKAIVRLMYAVPAGVARIKDPQAKYYTVMRLALPLPVAMMVAANPSTMINLARAGDLHKETLIRDVHDGTLSQQFDLPADVRAAIERRLRPHPKAARRLEQAAERSGHLYPRDAWSDPFLLGNWMGGSMGVYLRHYPRYFGNAPIRDVGLIASEGRMTIPFADGTPAGVLDVETHYFEFIPEDEVTSERPTVLAAHELREGQRYYILLTTGYGLYRYHIQDVVRVTGFFNSTPVLEFLSKGAYFSNLTGEKLSEYHITQSMMRVLREQELTLTTYSVAPCWPDDENELPGYGLFVEQGDHRLEALQTLAARLDETLCDLNIEYESKRASGRLAPLRLEMVPAGFWANWDRQRLQKTGGALEQYKHPCLINDLDFARQVRVTVR